MRTRWRGVDPAAPEARCLLEAAGVLRSGGVVAFPTETFYGLGVSPFDPMAVGRIFALKGRPESKPLLVLVDSIEMVQTLAIEIPERARELMARHWPGPLTLVLRARSEVPPAVTAGTGTIGVRLPAHVVARGLVRALAGPVTAPSANRSGEPPPTTAAGVAAQFPEGIDLVLDAGPTAGGLPSTVLDVSVDPPRVLRQGVLRL